MPIVKRAISPVEVSRHRLPANLHDGELQCGANGTLANVIRQISSLSKHAENIFGEIFHEMMKIEHRTANLCTRIDRLSNSVVDLGDQDDDADLQEALMRKQFRSNQLVDQQTLGRMTMPDAMGLCYSKCDQPPDLDALNVFRHDGRSGLKMYSNPEFFFELWREKMLRETDDQRKQMRQHQHRQQQSTQAGIQQSQQYDLALQKKRARQQQRNQFIQEVVNLPDEYQAPEKVMRSAKQAKQMHIPQGMVRPQDFGQQQNVNRVNGSVNRHPSMHNYNAAPVRANFDATEYGIEGSSRHGYELHTQGSRGNTPSRPNLPPPAPPAENVTQDFASMSIDRDGSRSPDLPPPPPPLMMTQSMMVNDGNLIYNAQFSNTNGKQSSASPPPPPPFAETVQVQTQKASIKPHSTAPSAAPPANIPPPPPPPPPGFLSGPAMKKETTPSSIKGAPPVKAKSSTPKPIGGVPMDLLAAIRQGKQLRKVDREAEEKKEKEQVSKGDVAAILQRRMRATRGGSSSSEPEEDTNNSEWDD